MVQGLTHSHSALVPAQLTAAQRALWERLPEDHRRFLAAHNGGEVEAFQLTFKTPIPHRSGGSGARRTDAVTDFFGLRMRDSPEDAVEDLLELSAEHAADEFLPRDVLAIARCVQNSLVCLSLRPDSLGRVFYWDWYWRYPWSKPYFDARLDAVRDAHPDSEAVLADREHPRFWELSDAFNFATTVELAPSFEAWLASCIDEREPEED